MSESLSLPIDQKLEQWREETRPRLPFTAEAYLAGTPIPEFVPPDPEKLDAILSYFGLQQDSFGCVPIPGDPEDIRTRLRLRSFDTFEAKIVRTTYRNLIYALASRPAMSGPYLHSNFFLNYRPFFPRMTCIPKCGNKNCINPFHMELTQEEASLGFWIREGYPLFDPTKKHEMYERATSPVVTSQRPRIKNKLFSSPFSPIIKAVEAVGTDPVLRVQVFGQELLKLIGPGSSKYSLWDPDHSLDHLEGEPIHLWKWRIRGQRIATFFSTSVRYHGKQMSPATAFWRLCFGSSPVGHRIYFGGQGREYRDLRAINERFHGSDNRRRKSLTNATHNFDRNYIDLNPFSYSLISDGKVEYGKDEYGNPQKEDRFISPVNYPNYCRRRGFTAPWPGKGPDDSFSLVIPDPSTGAVPTIGKLAPRNPAYPDDWLRV